MSEANAGKESMPSWAAEHPKPHIPGSIPDTPPEPPAPVDDPDPLDTPDEQPRDD